MEMFDGPSAVNQFAGEPVEKFGMGGGNASLAEIVDGADEAGAKVPVPDAVGHDPGGEGMLGMRQPFRELKSSARVGGYGKGGGQLAPGESRVAPRHRIALGRVGISSGMDGEIERRIGVTHRESEGQGGARLQEFCQMSFEFGQGVEVRLGKEKPGFLRRRRAKSFPPAVITGRKGSFHKDDPVECREGLVASCLEADEASSRWLLAESDGVPAKVIRRFPMGRFAEEIMAPLTS